jgi:hypothetical protein
MTRNGHLAKRFPSRKCLYPSFTAAPNNETLQTVDTCIDRSVLPVR